MKREELLPPMSKSLAPLPSLLGRGPGGGVGAIKGGHMTQPNIILILADDMGYSDIGCFGSEIATPNLDRLAAGGARFSQMYSFARCCPSRAALLTGLHPHQAGVGHMVANCGTRAYQGYLRDDAVTIAEVLKGAGYRTLMSGKWHTGGQMLAQEPEAWKPGTEGFPTPQQRGFDRFYGTLAGAGSFFYPHALTENGEFVQEYPDEFYYTDAISDKAIDMIDEARQDDMPFFLHVAYTAPHWPLHATPEDIAKYEGSYRGGWDSLRQQRHEELNSLGILDPAWRISPRDADSHPWESADNSDWEDLRMATYAAMIDRMDQGIGRILAKLDALDIKDDTLIIFLSDNGGCAELMAEDGWRDHRSYVPHLPDGTRVQIGNRVDLKPGPADTFMSYDLPWANASNSPFRLYKHWVHEGGISSPCIVHYPALIEAGAVCHSPAFNSSMCCRLSPSWLAQLIPTSTTGSRFSRSKARASCRRSKVPIGGGRSRSTGSTKATAPSASATGSWSANIRALGNSTI